MAEAGTYVVPRFRRWVDRLSGVLEIPPEIALDIPKATLIGHLQLQVENHRGVLEYTSRRVRIRTHAGELVVNGSRLTIGSIFQKDILIEGHITGVELPGVGRGT